MKINTKKTIKVLSGLALVSTVSSVTTNTADAKTYKPEVRYDNGNYFVKTSNPSATGKLIRFSLKRANSDEFLNVGDVPKYNNEEIEIKKESSVMLESEINNDIFVSIQDEEKRPKEEPEFDNITQEEYNKQMQVFYKEALSGAVKLGDAMNKETASKSQEAPQSTPAEKPESEPKETPQLKPQEAPNAGSQSKPQKAAQSSPVEKPEAEPKETLRPKPQDEPKTEPQSKPQEAPQSSPVEKPEVEPKETPQPKPQGGSKTERQSKLQELIQQDSGLDLFGQNKDSKKEDESKKQESVTLTKLDTKVGNKESVKNLANTGLETTSYALLASVVGLVGAMVLRRKNR